MSDVRDAAIVRNGRIEYMKRVDETPTTSNTTGTVTINNIGKPAIPAHYQVTFTISVTLQHDNIQLPNIFYLSSIVLNESDGAQYREIEEQAARQIAPMLRSIADHIEGQVADFDSQREKTKDN